jgi:hypothetical protein
MVLDDDIYLSSINIKEFDDYFSDRFLASDICLRTESEQFFALPGQEHYRLLAHLSKQFNHVELFDIGTSMGSSALALSFNPNNAVVTFDIKDVLTPERKLTKWKDNNICSVIEDLWDPTIRRKWKDRIFASPLLFIDVDPHHGYMEYDLYCWLKYNHYNGIALFDDFCLPRMKHVFWDRVNDDYKMDLTEVGHFTGSGAVCFHGQ